MFSDRCATPSNFDDDSEDVNLLEPAPVPTTSNRRTVIDNEFCERQSVIVSRLMEDDFERIEITYNLKQCFLGDQGIHLKPRCANLKIVLEDEARHILLNFKGGTAVQIPMDYIEKVEMYDPKLEGHYPIIRMMVTEYIGLMILAKSRSMKERRHHLEGVITDRSLLKFHRNCLTFLIKPQKHQAVDLFCKVKLKRETHYERYFLNAEGSMNIFLRDVKKWMEMSILEPIPIKYERITDEKWYDFLKKMELVCIKNNGFWSIEPKRHILRLKNFTSSFLLNTPERLIELHPPDHKELPLQEKHMHEDPENNKENDEKPANKE